MSLTPEQLAARTKTLGASEVSAVAGLSPWASALDVWATKCTGPELENPPVVPPDAQDLPAADPRTIGTILEDGIVALYARQTGLDPDDATILLSSGTCTHREHAWRTATPDRLVRNSQKHDTSHGLECKLVGRGQASEWDGGGLPDYVMAQIQWSMHVTGLLRWDVAALVLGTDFRVFQIERDEELIDALVDIADSFWHEHVLGARMPEAFTGRDAKRILLAKWREDDGTMVDAPAEAEPWVERLHALQNMRKLVDSEIEKSEALLCALVAEHKAISGAWGTYHWRTQQGSASWKAVAEELAGGEVPTSILERHRGTPFRVPRLYPQKRWAAQLVQPNIAALLGNSGVQK